MNNITAGFPVGTAANFTSAMAPVRRCNHKLVWRV